MRYVCINYGFVLAWLSCGEGRFWVQVIMFLAWNFNTMELTPNRSQGAAFAALLAALVCLLTYLYHSKHNDRDAA
jgi:hypothetical protein